VLDEAELGYEVVVMFVARVDVGLGPHAANAVKVVDVHVHEDTEQSAQHLLAHLLEVPGERNAWGRRIVWVSLRHEFGFIFLCPNLNDSLILNRSFYSEM
jgi:hypothetical protein